MLLRLNPALYWTLSWVVLFSQLGWSQSDKLAHHAEAEKIYLQLDGNVYTTDNVVWFKCIIINAADHIPTASSGVVYVELIDPVGHVLETKVLQIVKGIGKGFFQLDQRYQEGQHLVRAYTEWSKNYGADFFFETYIHLYAASDKDSIRPIDNIELLNRPGLGQLLNASLNPHTLDSQHKKDLTTYIWFDDHKDTLSIKGQGQDRYRLSLAVPEHCRRATIQFETKNRRSYSKSILLDQGLDLQFFPESGEMVQGLSTKVAFKAVDFSGQGKVVAGQISTRDGLLVANFKSNHLGMGTLIIPSPDTSACYLAKLTSPTNHEQLQSYALPAVAATGNVLSISTLENGVELTAASNYLLDENITIRVSCRGLDYLDVSGFLKNGVLKTTLPLNTLPEGIIAFTLMHPAEHILAERLFFNERQDTRIDIRLKTDKSTYLQREQTQLEVETLTARDSLPVYANISILVLNRSQIGQRQDLRQNILSHFLLSSDLSGKIESPGYYFDQDAAERAPHLDALLLTQGWRKYHYAKPPQMIQFPVESTLSISGQVRVARGSKRKKTQLTLATFGKPQTFETLIPDIDGKFQFDINNQVAENLNILIQSKNKAGKTQNSTIILNTKESPEVEFEHVGSTIRVDSTILTFIQENLQRKAVEDAQLFEGSTIDLDEVVVKAYKMTPARKKVKDQYGMPTDIIMGNDIQEKEADWAYGLYSVLKYNFPDQIDIVNYSNGVFAQVIGGGVTLVLIDGRPIELFEYSLIPNIQPSEIASFEILRYVPNFRKLFMRVFPHVPATEAERVGSVIAIYTKSGRGVFGGQNTKGIFRAAVPAFSPTREFYAPKYPQEQATDWSKPDLRAIVHWDPELISDDMGKVTTSFYNADNLGEMQIVVEAISGSGELGYKELIYRVKKVD